MKITDRLYNYIRPCWAIPLRGISYLWPRSNMKIVMGGWMGDLFNDNTKYLCLYLLQHTDFQITWIGNEVMHDKLPNHIRLSFVRKGSIRAFFALLRAHIWICCQAWNIDLTTLPISGTATIIDTWHGIPVKCIGRGIPSSATKSVRISWIKRLSRQLQYELPEWLVVSSEKMARMLAESVPGRYSVSRILACGTPRNDYLLQNKGNVELINKLKLKYAQLLDFDSSKRIVLYLPTWRMRGDCVFAFYHLETESQAAWKSMLYSHNAVLIEKHHYGTYAKYPLCKPSRCSVVIAAEQQKNIDVQELLLIADVLISDYSGAYIDFALLKRPVLHFVYDMKEYCNEDSGLAYDLAEVRAGPLVMTEPELRAHVCSMLEAPKFQPAKHFNDLVFYERGESCKCITDFIRGR